MNQNPKMYTWLRIGLLLSLFCIAARGDIGRAHTALENYLKQCVSSLGTLQRSLRSQLVCLKASIYQCVLFHDVRRLPYSFKTHHCGVLNSGMQLFLPTKWRIKISPDFVLKLDFIHFYFPSSQDCRFITSLHIRTIPFFSSSLHLPNGITKFVYCGHRMPWSLSFFESELDIVCMRCLYTLAGYHLVMIYQALDIETNSVGIVQWNYITNFGSENDPDDLFEMSAAYLTTSPVYNYPIIEVQLHVDTYFYKTVSVYYSPTIAHNIIVYDGPGSLSPQMVLSNLTDPATQMRAIHLSGYQGFIKFKTATNSGNKLATFMYASTNSFIGAVRQYVMFKDTRPRDHSNGCIRHGSNTTQFTTSNGRCYIRHPVDHFTIHRLEYFGFNTYFHDESGEIATCEYGGLFIDLLKKGKPYNDELPICANVTTKTLVPFLDEMTYGKGTQALRGGDMEIIISFITFDGYSNGFVDITFEAEKQCIGTNTAKVDEKMIYWADAIYDTQDEPSLRECTDYWITNNMQHEDVRFSTETYNFQMTAESTDSKHNHNHTWWKYRNQTYTGSKLIVAGYLFARTAAETRFFHPVKFNVHLNVAQLVNYPFHQTIVHYSESLLKGNVIEVDDFSAIMDFTLMYSGYDLYPVFVVRVQVINYHICSSVLFDNSPDISPIYRLYVSQDVSISRDFAYNEVWLKALEYKGHNIGPCRMAVTGQICVPKHTQYNIARINLDAMLFDSPVEVDISQKKTPGCSNQCSFNIGIRESRPEDKTYHLEWRGVKRITWQLKNLYFTIIDITSECKDCQKHLCDIAVAIRLKKPWIPVVLSSRQILMNIYHITKKVLAEYFSTRLSDHLLMFAGEVFSTDHSNLEESKRVYGSWYDAQRACATRGHHLPTWTPSLPFQLRYILHKHAYNFTAADDHIHFMHMKVVMQNRSSAELQHVFAGLHRNNSVSIASRHMRRFICIIMELIS